VDEVGAADIKSERRREGEVGGRAGVEVEGQDCGRVGDHGFDFDGVDEGFRERCVLEGGVVETVDVIPNWFKGELARKRFRMKER